MEFDEVKNNGSQDDSQPGGGGGGNNQANRERDRDRRGRGERGTRFSDANDGGGDRSRERRNCRIYISNIPYDYRWQDLKDLFRRVVGSVEYVELFSDENGKARGCGIVEFKDPENVQKALEKMNRYDINGREIVVKEDHGENRDQYGRIVRDGGGNRGGGGGGGGGGGPDRGGFIRRDRDDDRISGRPMGGSIGGGMMGPNDFDMPYNTYGLSTSFLESLGINGPLHNKVFVANLDYKVDPKKLKQVFKLAGKVQSVDLSVDKEGNSRGFAVIEYDHPVEAVQAISMFDRQMLYERRMTVRLDRIPEKGESIKLPEGLGGVGIGLGPNGEPLRDVARNLPNMAGGSSANAPVGGGGGLGNSNLNSAAGAAALNLASTLDNLLNQNNAPVPVAPPLNGPTAASLLSQSGVLSSTNLTALSNAIASNPLLSSSLSNLGLNLGSGGAGAPAPSVDSSNISVPGNNYNTGSGYNTGFSNSGFNSGSGRQDFDPSVRSYNTQPQNNAGDFGSSGNMPMFGSQNQSLGGGNLGGGNMGGGNMGGGNMGGNMGGGNMGGGNMGGSMGGGNLGGPLGGGGNQIGGNMGSGGRKSDTILIKNIPLSCTWQTLRDKFRDIGEVKFAEIRGNDIGVVRFFKEKDAELAIKLMDGSRMEGRVVNVSFF